MPEVSLCGNPYATWCIKRPRRGVSAFRQTLRRQILTAQDVVVVNKHAPRERREGGSALLSAPLSVRTAILRLVGPFASTDTGVSPVIVRSRRRPVVAYKHGERGGAWAWLGVGGGFTNLPGWAFTPLFAPEGAGGHSESYSRSSVVLPACTCPAFRWASYLRVPPRCCSNAVATSRTVHPSSWLGLRECLVIAGHRG